MKKIFVFIFFLMFFLGFSPSDSVFAVSGTDNVMRKFDSSGGVDTVRISSSSPNTLFFKVVDDRFGTYTLWAVSQTKGFTLDYSPSFTAQGGGSALYWNVGTETVGSGMPYPEYIKDTEDQIYFACRWVIARDQKDLSGWNFDHYIEFHYDGTGYVPEYRLYRYLVFGDSTGFNFDHFRGEYDQSIGVLVGLKYYSLSVPDEIPDSLVGATAHIPYSRFTFNSRSTTGFSLKLSDCVVRVYATAAYYSDGLGGDDYLNYSDPVLESPKVFIGEFDPSNLEITFSDFDYLNIMQNSLDKDFDYSLSDQIKFNIHRSDSLYFQIVDSTLGYGDFLRIKHFRNYRLYDHDMVYDAVNPDGDSVDSSMGGFDSSGSVPSGSGTADKGGDVDSAFDNAVNNGGLPSSGLDIDDISGAIHSVYLFTNDMVSLIGNIPLLISKVFSFLPPWCLEFLDICFVAMCVLLIIKIIRG